MPRGVFVPFAHGQRLPGFLRTEGQFHDGDGKDPFIVTLSGCNGFTLKTRRPQQLRRLPIG
jgi:hypothetical protein